MITTENELYIRFVLLLIEGGTDVLRVMLKRDLEKKNVTFGKFLSQFESKIINAKFLTNKQLKILYPVPTEPPDLSNCDISILAYLLNEFVTTKGSCVSKAINKIRKFRNEFFAHPKTASLEAKLFNSIWTTLSMAIMAITHDFTENERERFEETIERLSNDALDINSAVETLRRLDQTDEFNENINIRLTQLDQAVQYCHKDIELMKNQITELQRTFENQGLSTKVVNTVFGSLRLSALEQRTVDEAERVLLAVSKESLSQLESSQSHKTVRDTVDNLVHDLNDKGLKVEDVSEGSVVFTIKCQSFEYLIALIDYFDSPMINNHLDAISRALSEESGKKIEIHAMISTERLSEELKRHERCSKTVKVAVECSGLDSLKTALDVFGNGAAAINSFSGLQDALSEKIGKPLDVQPAIDLETMQTAIDNAKKELGIKYKMDNNPTRSPEGIDNEDAYVLAPEPPDEPDHVWHDAQLCSNIDHHQHKPLKSEVSSERNKGPPHIKTLHEEAKGKITSLKMGEEDSSVDRIVLDTDLDTMQQTIIQSEVKSSRLVKWKLKANVNSDEVKITFHVLIPSNVDFQTDKDNVILCIWKGNDSEYPGIEHVMEMVGYQQQGRNSAHLTGNIILKKGKLALNSLCYNYYIKRCGVSLFETNLPRTSTWEHIFFDSKSNKRKLHCIALKNIQGFQRTFHQYDGYIYESPTQGLLQTLTGFFIKTKEREDAETATTIFGRHIVHLLLRGQPEPVSILDATHMSDCLRLCIEKRYKIKDKGVKVTLWRLYTHVLHNLVGIEDDLSIQRKMSVCLLMLNIRHFVGYRSDDPAIEILCKSFLMKLCKKNRSTVEWDYLKEISIVQDRMSIKVKLFELAKDICSDFSNGKNPLWMYLLPVLHFLNGLSRPFQEIPLAFDHGPAIPKWWGIDSEIQNLTERFKRRHYRWCISLRNVIEKLEYMFEVDGYLQRTLMASLCLEELKDAFDNNIFPYEIGCASIFFSLKTLREYDGNEKALQKCTESLQRQMLTAKDERFGPRCVLVGLRSSYDLYRASLSRLDSELVLNTARIYLSFVARFDILQLKSSELAEELSKVSISLKEVSAKTFEWIDKIQGKPLTMFNLLQIWDQLLRPRGLTNSFHIEEWMHILITELRERIHTSLVNDHSGQFKQCLFEAYCAGIDTYSKELQDLLSSFIPMALPEHHNENTAVYLKLYNTVSKQFLTEWYEKLNEKKRMNLETIVTWTALPKLLKVLCHEGITNDQNKECQEIINSIKCLVEDFIFVLLDGKICVKLLQLMEYQKDVLFPLCDVLKFNTEIIIVALSKRREELYAFYKKRATLQAIKIFCDGVDEVQVDMKDVEVILQKNVGESALNELMVVQKLTYKPEEMSHNVQINVKNLNEGVMNMTTRLEELIKSRCFTAEAKSVIVDLQSQTSLSLNDLYEHVYLPSIERLKEKAEQISTGEITYIDMEDFVGKVCGMNYDTILFELKTVCPDVSPDVLNERVEQFKQCRQIRLVTKVASAFFKVKDVYGLSGNFSAFEHLKNYDIKTLTLSSEKGDILLSSRDLYHVTKEGVACLEAFANCADLISWLRDIIKGGAQELKVFVECGLIYAGDDSETICRIQCLNVVVTGYATLIFKMEETSGSRELLKACDSVFEELQNTPKLPEKLEYAQRYLHWFKEIKQAYSVVDDTALMQAKNINERGVYRIGTQVWKAFGGHGCQFSLAEFSGINEILKLTLVMDEGSNREYTYDKLQDLQTRLMLVADKAEKSMITVERFNQIFERVVRLGNIYIKLVKSGCMFFQNLAIELVCDTNQTRPTAASLYISNQASTLHCRKTGNERLENIMHRISTTMESCFTGWLEHVDKHRQNFPELNYFTIEQLVILQIEFCKLHENKEPSKMIYPMLYDIIQNCKPGDIKDAFFSSSSEINGGTGKELATIMNESVAKISPEENFMPELIEKEMILCMKDEDKIDELKNTQSFETTECESEESKHLEENETDSQNPTCMVDDMKSQFDGCENMLIKFKEIWKQFLESSENNLNNCISLKHVGMFLRHLAEKDQRKINRSLPRGCSERSPNLVVCKNENIWSQTLSLYLCDKSQPLPLHDEILTCSEDTSIEQVDIFMRRALFNSCGKIHTLINADTMSFTLCEGIEQRLLKYQRVVHSDYRLVFICGSDSENRSVLISSLDKYRRTVFLMDKCELCTCLLHKLQNTSTSDTISPAASVDFEKSTVRAVKSSRSGCGKTLYVLRKEEELQQTNKTNVSQRVSLPLHTRNVNFNYVTSNLLQHIAEPEELGAKILHIDITNEVQFGIDYLLFNLLILGALVDKSGYIWRKMPTDLYLIETREQQSLENEKERLILHLLPFVVCRSPKECLDIYKGNYPEDYSKSDQLLDSKLYEMELYQTPYECLKSIDYPGTENSKLHCIETMLRHCGVSNPSWSEIHHFVKFLNTQLQDFTKTIFGWEEFEKEVFPGFSTFIKRFLIQMSRDFSSRSLNLSEESYESMENDNERNDLRDYAIKRTWETSPHPYLFFNADGQTFTFLGLDINNVGDLVDIHNNRVLEKRIMRPELRIAMRYNHFPMNENFDFLARRDKIERLCRVIGVDRYNQQVDDETYELTTDNCKKMLAVYMRFRCGIPVIIMGETGCGKTRLLKFLCEIMVPRDKDTKEPLTTNMISMKVHGDVTNEDIKSKVWKAERKALDNTEKYGENVYTVLFFDEANTTESIGLIKEIMCDNTMEGKPLNICINLKFVAACNPYRKHPKEVITKLEKAGLGYHVKAIQTKDRFGRIPMRRLVYRVQPLPQTLLSFVSDFGQLSASVENLYIRHMVRKYMQKRTNRTTVQLPDDGQLLEVISSILTQSQEYMRNLKDECSFVSLRDVDRVLQVMCWFYSMSKNRRTLFKLADEKLRERNQDQKLTDETRSLLLALAVCYHSSLSQRTNYWKHMSQFFRMPCEIYGGYVNILDEIDRVQEVFLDSVKLAENDNIARNHALKENVFMMVVCIELRIPLFLVGKPGSSKSLAKVIVADAMQGRAAKTPLFRELKQVQMVSLQCSALSLPEDIISTFHKCASIQKDKDLDSFVSVVVLDEIGLAEDSERMPLKTLHPLLENGCQGDEIAEYYKKVAFIGISNWSLDPAKMNRGIFVQRQVPELLELENTARGICASTPNVNNFLIKPLSSGYMEVLEKSSEKKREFFGLRDFYSLMKMINHIVLCSKQSSLPSYIKLRFAVRRNFSGLENIDTLKIFLRQLTHFDDKKERQQDDPDDSFTGLLKSWISNEYSESRHLLLLTENYSAIAMFEQVFLTINKVQPVVIFGSSFRHDQEYTQICRNINKIKICMETGKLVILVNSDNLYESLYGALNQYYVYFGGERYVDLGLGTHRVKCPVHKDFKLIFVAEKQTVYERSPIPLIQRLEKHCLMSTTLLNKYQKSLAKSLKEWVEGVTKQSLSLRHSATENDVAKVFIGYHHDVCAILALKTLTDETVDNWNIVNKVRNRIALERQGLEKSKDMLLWCAAPDAILRLSEEQDNMQDTYWNKQAHESLKEYLSFHFKKRDKDKFYAQITTHSSLVTAAYTHTLGEATGIHPNKILILEALPFFDTEQQFISKIKGHILKSQNDEPVLIVVQCDSGDRYTNLIACAKYAILDECSKLKYKAPVNIIFIVQLTPMENKHFHSIQCGDWHSAHIDNLYSPEIEMPSINDMQRNRMSVLIAKSNEGRNNFALDQNDTPHEQDKCLNLRLLIERSLQRAVSLVRDPEENKYRSTKRVSLILLILHDTSNKDCGGFVRGISVLVQKIMADMENEPLPTSPDMWLSKEAASIVAIEKFGTFRRACIEAFDTRMSPILGGLFAALDTNHNLNLLECGVATWQRNLWIALINTKEVGVHLFRKVHTDRGLQFKVYSSGYGGRLFQCKVPFSWIMLSTFDAFLQKHDMLLQETHEQEKKIVEISGEMELIRAIDSVPKKDFYDVIESYINDFVQTVYPEEKDRYFIFMSIKQLTLGRITSENTSVSAAFILVHQVYQETKTRFNYYRDISNVWCGCTDAVMACDSKFDDPERTLVPHLLLLIRQRQFALTELIGLTALIEHISPESKVDVTEWFKSDKNRDNWLEQVQRYRQVVNQTLAFCQDNMTNSSLVARERSRWNRIVVMQLCIKTLTSEEDKNFPIDIIASLWKILDKGNMDMKCIEPLKEIERFLVAFLKKTKHSPVRGGVERIREYRQRCYLVLMDIVSQLCFADNTSPDSDVIEWLLSNSFKSAIGEEQQLLKENETDIGVDSNKNFKVFTFKHLLRTDEHEFSKHLEKFVNSMDIDGSQSRELDDVIVSLIFIIEDYLLEIISFNEICKLETIGEYLGDSLHLLEQNSTSVDQIYGIAQARAALSVTASCIALVSKQTVEHESEEMGGIKAVLQRAESLCRQRTLIWKFLLKHLAQEFGTDTLLAACKSPNSMVNWIAMDENVTSTVDMYTACGEEYCTIKLLLLSSLIESEQNKLLTYIQSRKENQALVVMFELAVHREFLLHHRLKHSIITTQEHKLVEKIGLEFKERCQKASFLALDESIHIKYNLQVLEGTDADRDMSIKCILFHWLCVITHFSCSRNGILRPLFKLALQPGDLKDLFLPCMPEDGLASIRQQLLNDANRVFFGERTMYYRCENGHGYEIGQCGRPFVKAKCLCGADICGESHILQLGNEPDDGSDRSQKGHCLGYPQDRQPGAVPERSLSALQNALLKCLLHLSMYLGCGNSQNDVSVMVKQQTDSIHTFIWDHILIDLEDLMSGMSLNRDEVLLLMHSLIDSILRTGIQTDCITSGGEQPQKISTDELEIRHLDSEFDTDRDVDDEVKEDDHMKYGADFHPKINENDDSDDAGMQQTFSETCIEDISGIEGEVQTESFGQFHSTDFPLKEEQPWATKLGRGRWEEEFAKRFLTRFLEERKTTLNLAKQYLEGNSTTGILAVLNDKQTKDNIQKKHEDSKISDNPLVWIYRKPVSIWHFKQAFQQHMDTCSSGEKKFTVLSMFLKQINALQALRFVPSILQLNKTLIQRYNRQIYQSEASKITVKQIKEDLFEDTKLFEDMFEAWNTVRNALKYHEFTTDKGRTAIPLEWANMRLTDETELAYLLPAMDGKGICTFALLDFLLRLQNEVIDTYLSSLSGEMKQVFTIVEPRDITAAHLINFHPEKDLLPIILDNCSMSSTHIVSDEYDFKAIQNRMIDRFISTKSKVVFDRRFKIDLIVYRSDASQFHILLTKIPQERLDSGVKLALCNQVQDVPSLGQLLSQLDIAIKFLNITGGEPGDSLHEYILGKLQLTNTNLTSKIQQHCLLKHVKSLWMTFSFHRSYIMARQGKQVQVIFENFESKYHESLPKDIMSVCQSFAESLPNECLTQFLELSFEFIMLELAKRENKDYFDKSQYRLKDCLTAFGDLNGLDVDVNDIPTSVLSIHSLHMWIVVSQILQSRVENNYETEI